ncbi:MAG TPA: 23S rRNA (uracil(1939)-C(5))-methyltransferase RlmD [Chlamydiales bacterium]|nr:MAG: 23S rRNA (uracil-5-)-methyltransferase RumA [Verrucomicrobia bacterium RIFCSPHIGHO2_12_FULL_41_10]HLB52644.1 23S rRNA (uracil(1939)-C(5))-methyltransferase RlmD [Chlamydiales bacterium]
METIQIHALGSLGEGVGELNGYTLFVEGALPGETATIEVIERNSRFGIGKLKEILLPSSDRIDPICPYFGSCGGCQLMHLSYPKQLQAKTQRVIDALKRIGKLDLSVLPCLPSPKKFQYRNKIQLPVQKKGNFLSLGLYKRSSHELVPIEKCHIHTELGDQIYQKIKPLIEASKIDHLRHILIKSSGHFGEALVVLVTSKKEDPQLHDLAEQILKKEPFVKGVIQNLHRGPENVILGSFYRPLAGEGSIREKICGLFFRVSPASFFQVNVSQAEALYLKALEWGELTGKEKILDAYCGVGTLSLIFAPHVKEVFGIESVPQAIVDAKENAKMNGLNNVHFICGKVEDELTKHSPFDLILINPPRKGCSPEVLKSLRKITPEKLLYISCDPATLARDLKELCQSGYHVEKVQPFDMFPQTAHVETVVLLTKFAKTLEPLHN